MLHLRVLITSTEKVTTLPNLSPENTELFLISGPDKIKHPFCLFRKRAANFQIYAKLSERIALTRKE